MNASRVAEIPEFEIPATKFHYPNIGFRIPSRFGI